MTIPASNNWCPDCDEACHGHARVCTVCGATLTQPPTAAASSHRASARNNPHAGVSFRAMPELEAFLPAAMTTAELLRDVRHQVQATTALAQQSINNAATNNAAVAAATLLQGGGGEWEAVPAEWMEPSAATTSGKHPTSPEVLKNLPREILNPKSQLLFQVSLEIITTKGNSSSSSENTTTLKLEGVTGELGPLPSILTNSTATSNSQSSTRLQVEGPLWIPPTRAQRTGKEPFQINDKNDNCPPEEGCIVVLERGHNISFFQKAHAAQTTLNAQAVLILNDRAEPWPYVMKDSRTETQKQQQPITIPVIMISQAQGQQLLQECANSNGQKRTAQLVIQHHPDLRLSCVICREALEVGQTTMTLSKYCGHTFHESCALQWLQHHSTCPYCRRNLPTDDADYNAEQQARQRREQQESSNAAAGTRHGDVFYS
jgi:hypothetical protein